MHILYIIYIDKIYIILKIYTLHILDFSSSSSQMHFLIQCTWNILQIDILLEQK